MNTILLALAIVAGILYAGVTIVRCGAAYFDGRLDVDFDNDRKHDYHTGIRRNAYELGRIHEQAKIDRLKQRRAERGDES